MKIGHRGVFERDLGRLFEGESVAGLGEVQLLERFVERRDEPAFAALVARHGPMVLGVCRRLLVDPLDVEDAFQATFLVLVRRAGSLRDRDRLAPWLFGVARRVATRTRMDLARRRARERPDVEALNLAPGVDDPTRELGRALVEEIDRLPGSLRDPILLCCVEGLTYDEAASRLRSTAPAVRGKLSRARERLRARLTRRGFAPSAGILGALLSAEAASAAVSTRLIKTTIRASTAGTVPAGVEALAEGVIRTMILTKTKFLAATLVACGLAGSSVGVFGQDGPPLQAREVPATPPETPQLNQLEKKLDRILEALEGSNQPAPRRGGAMGGPGMMGGMPGPGGMPMGGPGMMGGPGAMGGIMGGPGMMGGLRQGTDIRGTMGSQGSATTVTRSATNENSPLNARVNALESKLERIEARLAEVERKLGSERRSGSNDEASPDVRPRQFR